MFEIADDGTNDWMERQTRGGEMKVVGAHEHIDRSRLRVDTRKWALARMSPKKYGDQVAMPPPGSGESLRPIVIMIRTNAGEVPSVSLGDNGQDRLSVHS